MISRCSGDRFDQHLRRISLRSFFRTATSGSSAGSHMRCEAPHQPALHANAVKLEAYPKDERTGVIPTAREDSFCRFAAKRA
jgi:hypothetical protein